jgi:hypothetical protein
MVPPINNPHVDVDQRARREQEVWVGAEFMQRRQFVGPRVVWCNSRMSWFVLGVCFGVMFVGLLRASADAALRRKCSKVLRGVAMEPVVPPRCCGQEYVATPELAMASLMLHRGLVPVMQTPKRSIKLKDEGHQGAFRGAPLKDVRDEVSNGTGQVRHEGCGQTMIGVNNVVATMRANLTLP